MFISEVLPVKNKLFRFALRLLNNEDDAKDVVQEVFIRVWNSREKLKEIQNLEAWCMRITKNIALDKMKSSYYKNTGGLENHNHILSSEETPYQTTMVNDTIINIQNLISGLPEKQRDVIQLRDIEGYSYKEICEILTLDMSQVKINLFRARQTLKDLIVKKESYGL